MMAAILSMILRKPLNDKEDYDDDEELMHLEYDEELLHNRKGKHFLFLSNKKIIKTDLDHW